VLLDLNLDLFVAEPEHNVPGNQPHTARVEPLVEGGHSLTPGCSNRAVESALVLPMGTVHKPGLDHIDRTGDQRGGHSGDNSTGQVAFYPIVQKSC